MRAIIPVAGSGARLNPITDCMPKVLIEVAGKPMLAHILDNLKGGPITELVLIVGHFKEMVIDWVTSKYKDDFVLHFVSQEEQLGLGHAIYTSKDFLNDTEILIVLGDEIFSIPYHDMIAKFRNISDIDGAIGIKLVDDPTHYGMVKIGPNNYITDMVEKSSHFPERTAIAGVYYFRTGYELKESLDTMMKERVLRNEYQLTDAIRNMIINDSKMLPFDVGEWYDCGRLETLIDSNRRLLERNNNECQSCQVINSQIIQPCFLGPNSSIINSRIGPYVSIGQNVRIENSYISNTILESHTIAKFVTLDGGIIFGNGTFENQLSEESTSNCLCISEQNHEVC